MNNEIINKDMKALLDQEKYMQGQIDMLLKVIKILIDQFNKEEY